MRLFAIVCSVLLLTGCADDLSCSDLTEFTPIVELGQGELDFEPLLDGDELRTYFGPQGLSHSFLAVRTSGLKTGKSSLGKYSPNAPDISFTLSYEGLAVAGGLVEGQRLDGDTYEAQLTGIVALHRLEAAGDIMDTFYSEDGMMQEEFTLQVQVVDECGNQAEDERSILYTLF